MFYLAMMHSNHFKYYKTVIQNDYAVLLNFLLIRDSWKKCIIVDTKIWSNTTVFNIYNKNNQHVRMISEGSLKTGEINYTNITQYYRLVSLIKLMQAW